MIKFPSSLLVGFAWALASCGDSARMNSALEKCQKIADPTACAECLDSLLRKHPDNPGALHARGALALGTGAVKPAGFWLAKANRLAPGNVVMMNDLALAQAGCGEGVEAMKTWFAALEIDEENPLIRLNLARAFASAGRWEDAARHTQVVLGTSPMHAEALAVAAEIWPNLNDPAAWCDIQVTAWEASEKGPARRLALADALSRVGRHREAIAHYSELTGLDEWKATAWHGVGRAWMAAGGAVEATLAFTRAAAAAPDALGFKLDLCRALIAQNNVPAALQAEGLVTTLLEQLPDDPDLHLLAGTLYDDAGELDSAIFHYLNALLAGADQPRLPLYLGEAYLRQGETGKARELLEAAVNRWPEGSAEITEARELLARMEDGP